MRLPILLKGELVIRIPHIAISLLISENQHH